MANWNGSYYGAGQNYYNYYQPVPNTPGSSGYANNWGYYPGVVPNAPPGQTPQLYGNNPYGMPPQSFFQSNPPPAQPLAVATGPNSQYADTAASPGYYTASAAASLQGMSGGGKRESVNMFQNSYIPSEDVDTVNSLSMTALMAQTSLSSQHLTQGNDAVQVPTVAGAPPQFSRGLSLMGDQPVGMVGLDFSAQVFAQNADTLQQFGAAKPFEAPRRDAAVAFAKDGWAQRVDKSKHGTFQKENNNNAPVTGVRQKTRFQNKDRVNIPPRHQTQTTDSRPVVPPVSTNTDFSESAIEAAKSQGRQKLLADAAMFMNEIKQAESSRAIRPKSVEATSPPADPKPPPVEVTSNDQLSSGSSGSPTSGASRHYNQRGGGYKDASVRGGGNRVFTNSRYSHPPPSLRGGFTNENRKKPGNAFSGKTGTGGLEEYESDAKPATEVQLQSPIKIMTKGNFPGSYPSSQAKSPESPLPEDEASRIEYLVEQLTRGSYECMVCCERVRQFDPIRSCNNCFHMFHLKCIRKWAKSSQGETGGWRCPACQNVSQDLPQNYYCFCGKLKNPEWNRRDTPHACGDVCGKERLNTPVPGECVHKCTLLCHPGPCPPCAAQIMRTCPCGKLSQMVMCGQSRRLVCENICEILLNCGIHNCSKKCHVDPCGDCPEMVHQVCYCGKEERDLPCSADTVGENHYSCGNPCGKQLACGNHACQSTCHEGECDPCPLRPEAVTVCPCGQTSLEKLYERDGVEPRKSCSEPIPTCGKTCNKKLVCGQPNDPHRCQAVCHLGICPPCPLATLVKCRCGHMDKEIECTELKSKADDARCEKRCNKKRSCGRHKCTQECCIDIDHVCPLICNQLLSCGLHRCEELCHRGNCPQCWQSSFEELFCECGVNVIYPPVPCGTKPPECLQACTRQHECEHPVYHKCHSEPTCPPCTVLTARWCHGNHELRKSVPCHQKEISCGLACNKELACGRHRCIQICHKGECLKEGEVCQQPCPILRASCGHSCAAPCHEGACPEIPCKEMVKVTCQCGHRTTTRSCSENEREYRRITVALLGSKMNDVQQGLSIDLKDYVSSGNNRKENLKSLECNEDCAIIERNKRMALALQIQNPDLSSKLGPPKYTDFMKQWAKKDARFVQIIHDKLTELVQLAKQSKQKSRSHSFDAMNKDKRQLIHEYAEHFGCECQSYDPEPHRNVVATAYKDRSWLPSMSLLEFIMREAGQRKVPGPIIGVKGSNAKLEMQSVKTSQGNNTQTAVPVAPESEKTSQENRIDYFDFGSS